MRRFLLKTVIGACLAAPPASAAPDAAEYESWVACHTRKDLVVEGMMMGPQALKLVITAFDEHDVPLTSTSLTERGEVSISRPGEGGEARVNRGAHFYPADLERLEQLLSALPEERTQLPPGGRRLLLQIISGEKHLPRFRSRQRP